MAGRVRNTLPSYFTNGMLSLLISHLRCVEDFGEAKDLWLFVESGGTRSCFSKYKTRMEKTNEDLLIDANETKRSIGEIKLNVLCGGLCLNNLP